MREFMRKARPWASLLVVSGLVAACGGDDDPTGPAFSAEAAEQTADAADEVAAPLESSFEVSANVWNAFGTLIGLGGGAVSPMVPFETARSVDGMKPGSRWSLPSLSPTAPLGVLLPEEVMGVTFAWDVDSDGYVATTEAGAPSNGVRFIYYAVSPFSGQPVEPLNALGYLQFVDASTSTAARLEVDAVRSFGNVQLADYFVQGSLTGNLQTSIVTIESEGFVSDGSEQVAFDITFVVSETATTVTNTASVTLANAFANASISFDYLSTGTEAGVDEEGTFIVEHGNNEAVFDFTGVFVAEPFSCTVEGALSYNGNEVVIFEGDGSNPEFTRPDGSDLTAAEVQALGRIWLAFATTQIFVLEIVAPFFFLLVFAAS
ncbi:MAG TPA: hypothetical protein VMN78_13425 [Longimicrobiales bacterium]|nr:hypothetical protein [Longimicrobiales bacterium]